MRPALRRLLARPASLELLQCLVERPQEFRQISTKSPLWCHPPGCCRHSSNVSAAIYENFVSNSGDIPNPFSELPLPRQVISKPGLLVRNTESGLANNRRRHLSVDYGPWKENMWTREEIELESNLEEKGIKLVDKHSHQKDLRLWACLFNYRQRMYGVSGVRMFWAAAKRGDFQVPMTGVYAQLFWDEFVKLGLQDDVVLSEIIVHANQRMESTKERWPELYIRIVQQMMLSGRGEEAVNAHERLFQLHAPDSIRFANMICEVVAGQGDASILSEIYANSNYRNIYGRVVPFLCEQEDFDSAYRWHFICITRGDLPVTSRVTEPLVHFYAIYDRIRATKVTSSLVKAGVPFASSISSTLEDTAMISREMVNLMHGETFNMPAKPYNDRLGARWFATRWISLDVAMTAISALGVCEIGPLSLQALALREQDAESITRRINQLKDLNISIGSSIFSRSVEKFARTQNQAYLDCLLQSDQHPDALEDSKFQEGLLISYARSGDSLRYQLTLAMRLISSKNPDLETKNILLRNHAKTGNTTALLASLHKMQVEGEIITVNTVKTILRGVLRPRQPGRRPITSPIKQADDLKMAIDILKGIMQSGSFVSATYWREIIKRLGMLGRWKDLEDLCVFLASWYGPANRETFLNSATRRRFHRYRVPAQVRTIHPLHPLKILFPTSLQRAIVEWGFMCALKAPIVEKESNGLIHKAKPSLSVTAGIQLLKRLHAYHVHIDIHSVRKAIFDRLVVYYGPGQSSKLYNRRGRENNTLRLEEMAAQIDQALGVRMFDSPHLKEVIERRSEVRLRKAGRKIAGRLGMTGQETLDLP